MPKGRTLGIKIRITASSAAVVFLTLRHNIGLGDYLILGVPTYVVIVATGIVSDRDGYFIPYRK